ncbi:uncharacterized protein LOC115632922 [Scaptodrosophila lebanonensis]|uniref:Uncharacterized protein LOC115632922 n=1 Tax=Drosophila lebanonensis TaxID=7225 RepID=A0A6J2UCF4_DROLE|nr:uncharacterized protein LOC115632922 [Scaptodrosophila lebanonensis]
MPKPQDRSKSKQARLEQEVELLRHELATLRFDSDELQEKHSAHLRHCGGGEDCRQLQNTALTQAKRIKNQDIYIAFLEEQIRQTRTKYEQKIGSVKVSANLLDVELKKVRKQLHDISSKAQQVDKLEQKLHGLQQKLKRRDTIIEHYNSQHTDIMAIIHELQSRIGTIKPSRTMGTQTIQDLEKEKEEDNHLEVAGTDETLDVQLANEFSFAFGMGYNTTTNFANLTSALKNKLKVHAASSTGQCGKPN